MKRLPIILFIFLYLLTTLGVSAKLHYCDGDLETISLNSVDKPECCCGDEADDSGCCRDNVILIQTLDYHNLAVLHSVQNIIPSSLDFLFPIINLSNYTSLIETTTLNSAYHAPPPLSSHSSIFIRIRSILI